MLGSLFLLFSLSLTFLLLQKVQEESLKLPRFTLDAMPGKQMAIDADLNAGLINDVEAKQRRQEIAEKADFYGSMDGAVNLFVGMPSQVY